MDRRFYQLVIILLIASVGYSILSTPGNHFRINIAQLKTLLLYVLIGGCGYATYLTIRRPPGL